MNTVRLTMMRPLIKNASV